MAVAVDSDFTKVKQRLLEKHLTSLTKVKM